MAYVVLFKRLMPSFFATSLRRVDAAAKQSSVAICPSNWPCWSGGLVGQCPPSVGPIGRKTPMRGHTIMALVRQTGPFVRLIWIPLVLAVAGVLAGFWYFQSPDLSVEY